MLLVGVDEHEVERPGTAAGATVYDYLQALVRARFGDRLLFGFDQMLWPDAIGLAIEGALSH